MSDLNAASPAPQMTRTVSRRGLWLAFVRIRAVALVVFAFAGLLVQDHSRLPRFVYPVLFALPLCLAMLRREARAIRLWGAYVVSFVVFSLVRGHADDIGFPVRAEYVADIDRWLGLGTVPTHALQAILPLSGVAVWTAVFVHLTYYAAPPLVGLLYWLRAPERFFRYAYGFVAMYGVSLAVHIVVPTVPPWLAAIRGTIGPVRRLLAEALNGWNPSFYQYGLYVAAGNDVAAMPSVHAAATALILCAAWRTRWRLMAAVYAALMALALMYLGEHYLTDILAGFLIAGAAWWATKFVEGWNDAHQSTADSTMKRTGSDLKAGAAP
jgi:membrane-associated phospholipid phosphatase